LGILAKFFKRKIFSFLKCLKEFSKEFLSAKTSHLYLFWVFEKSKKTRFWDFDLVFHFLSYTRDFPNSFSLLLVSKNTLIPHLSYLLS